jgi:hypothetical protein
MVCRASFSMIKIHDSLISPKPYVFVARQRRGHSVQDGVEYLVLHLPTAAFVFCIDHGVESVATMSFSGGGGAG